MDHPVDVIAFKEELSLRLISRKAVDDEPVIPVVIGQALPDHAFGQIVGDEQACRHGAPDLGS